MGSKASSEQDATGNETPQLHIQVKIPKWLPPQITDFTRGGEEGTAAKNLVRNYLKHFGYYTAEDQLDEESLSLGITSFQKAFNLPTTGKYDEPTRVLMARPRCSQPDRQMGQEGGDIRPFFTLWSRQFGNKTDLTYSIGEITPDLPPLKVRRAIGDALNCWGAVTPLSFREVASGADMTLSFVVDPIFSQTPGVNYVAWGFAGSRVIFDEEDFWSEKFLSDTTLHELGHVLGLGHSGVPAATMWPYVGNPLHPDDIHAIHSLYGWRQPKWKLVSAGILVGPGPPINVLRRPIAILAASNQFFKLLANGSVLRYNGPSITGWELIGNTAGTIQIVCTQGILYALDRSGNIRRWSGTALDWRLIDTNPDTVEITAGSGQVYLRHFNQSRNYAAIYQFRGDSSLPRWELIDDNSRTRQIAAGDGGSLYQRHDNGSIWRYTGPGIRWELAEEHAGATSIAVGGSKLYYLTATGLIWEYTFNSTGTLINLISRDANTKSIYARGSFLLQIKKDSTIWRYSGVPHTGWELLDDFKTASSGVVSESGDIYQLSGTGAIQRLVV
ncbi:Matrilysin [Dactylella cylindrospora]|nr:Matrilysin [Dactylella cylindrospora]